MNNELYEYGCFNEHVPQRIVDGVARKVKDFKEMLGITATRSTYEIVLDGEKPKELVNVLEYCERTQTPLLTFSLSTLHPNRSRAIMIAAKLMGTGCEVYFVDPESTIEVITQ